MSKEQQPHHQQKQQQKHKHKQIRHFPMMIVSTLLLFIFPPSCSSFTPIHELQKERSHNPIIRTTSTTRFSVTPIPLSASSSEKKNKIAQPVNEFSRVYNVNNSGNRGVIQSNRDYRIDIEANETELVSLAQRFSLHKIDLLQAQLSLRQDMYSDSGVEVEGTVKARVVQTCVRTCELFRVDVEFPLFAIVRPVASIWSGDDDKQYNSQDEQLNEELQQKLLSDKGGRWKKGGGKKGRNERKQKSATVKTQAMQEMDIMELQRLLQDFDVEDEDVMEDPSIFTTSQPPRMDVGELVAQLFWLKLDPYPKKPGTKPITRSMSSD